jgi:hypothetical protein
MRCQGFWISNGQVGAGGLLKLVEGILDICGVSAAGGQSGRHVRQRGLGSLSGPWSNVSKARLLLVFVLTFGFSLFNT